MAKIKKGEKKMKVMIAVTIIAIMVITLIIVYQSNPTLLSDLAVVKVKEDTSLVVPGDMENAGEIVKGYLVVPGTFFAGKMFPQGGVVLPANALISDWGGAENCAIYSGLRGLTAIELDDLAGLNSRSDTLWSSRPKVDSLGRGRYVLKFFCLPPGRKKSIVGRTDTAGLVNLNIGGTMPIYDNNHPVPSTEISSVPNFKGFALPQGKFAFVIWQKLQLEAAEISVPCALVTGRQQSGGYVACLEAVWVSPREVVLFADVRGIGRKKFSLAKENVSASEVNWGVLLGVTWLPKQRSNVYDLPKTLSTLKLVAMLN